MQVRRTVVVLAGVLAAGVAGCSSGAEESPVVEVPPFEVVRDEGRVTELLSQDVDADGARAVIDAWVAEYEDDWEGVHTVQVIARPDAGMVVCRAQWVEDEEASEVLTGGRVTSGDGTWPVVEVDCP